MSFGLHLLLSVVWLLITLSILVFGVWSIFAKLSFIVGLTCFAIVAIFSIFLVNDFRTLFLNKPPIG